MPAHMYPQYVKRDEQDQEYKIYEALRDNLDENYHVFHNLDMIGVNQDNYFYRHEADFVIYHKDKGIIVIEAKNGAYIRCEDDEHWFYSNGDPMPGKGPYFQADENKRTLLDHIKERNKHLANRCKFLCAVWFHGMGQDRVKEQLKNAISVSYDITLTKEDLKNPKEKIDKIFEIKCKPMSWSKEITTRYQPGDDNFIINKVLYPKFNIGNLSGLARIEYIFANLLEEQQKVLYYLEEQKTAIISGSAGTGKTFIALKKAKNVADKGEKVLFLCFNSMLKDRLAKNNKHDNIDFYTLDGFCKPYNAIKDITTGKGDYDKLYNILDANKEDFKYQHVIIDEGQDFFQTDGALVISLLYEIMRKKNGTFYLFYDKNQLIQYDYSNKNEEKYKELLEYIHDPDCKLTLYKNCRNTKDIADTSSRIFSEDDNFKKEVLHNYNSELVPQIYIDTETKNSIEKLNEVIKNYKQYSDDIVILTCKGENSEKNLLTNFAKNNMYKGLQYTTCRKFKGCEADIVILLDIRKEHLIDTKKRLLYYEGTSRARYGLTLFCNLSDEDCKDVISSFDKEPFSYKRNSKYILADKLNAEIIN